MKMPISIAILTAALTLPLMACKDSAEAQKQAKEDEALNKVFGNLNNSRVKGHEKDKSTKNGK